MTLRQKVLLFVAIGMIASLSLLFLVSHYFLFQGYSAEEDREMQLDTKRALAAFSTRLTEMSLSSADYARWDDTYRFVRDGNAAYIRSNLVPNTFSNLRINLIAIIDGAGHPVFVRSYDFENNRALPPPRELPDLVKPGSALTAHHDLTSEINGVVVLAEGALLVSSHPILTSDRRGPIRGSLIMGRFIDQPLVKSLNETSQLSLILQPLDRPLPPELAAIPSQLSEQNPFKIVARSSNRIEGFTLIRDIFGRPALLLRVAGARDIYRQGQVTILAFTFILVIVALVVIGVILFILEKLILARLTDLSRSVIKVGRSGQPSQRVPVRGKDELGGLAEEINKMLAALETSRSQLAENELKFKTLFESSPEAIYLETLEDGRIADCNQAAARMTGYAREELIGMNARDLVPEETAKTFPALIESTLKTGGYFTRAFNKKKNGEVFPVEVSIKMVEIGEKKFSLVVVHDISDRQRAEAELKERFRELEEFHDLTVGRELKMVELEKEINGLLRELGREPKYKV